MKEEKTKGLFFKGLTVLALGTIGTVVFNDHKRVVALSKMMKQQIGLNEILHAIDMEELNAIRGQQELIKILAAQLEETKRQLNK